MNESEVDKDDDRAARSAMTGKEAIQRTFLPVPKIPAITDMAMLYDQ